ncbi:copper chaperone [Thiogranum longum]|uniref:Copper chaperone n=1 Tax=Thiogranum longum TaxID=1537524 RepID=A0A4R1HLE2_9GAMM|nr:heavy metal-associated domain-containing protein [Thiogranum longum]TCK18032.1 copper chaperone [Thiogranum longum]
MSYEIEVENIKCSGCAGTIVKRLSGLDSVDEVQVDVELGIVRVTGDELARAEVCVLLEVLGYPESGSTSGVNSVKAKAKSFVSCAVGRFADKPSD